MLMNPYAVVCCCKLVGLQYGLSSQFFVENYVGMKVLFSEVSSYISPSLNVFENQMDFLFEFPPPSFAQHPS